MKPKISADREQKMNTVRISEIREIIKFSGLGIEAVKRGSGMIHLHAQNYNEMVDFRAVCQSNGIYINVNTYPNGDGSTYAYVGGRISEAVSA
jgi:hypothetical protein